MEMMEYHDETNIAGAVRRALMLPYKDPRMVSPLVLAYIGDTVYDLFVRTLVISHSDLGVHGLHKLSAGRVCAAAQAAAYHRIADKLTQDEQDVYKRGRNAHMGTVPKHASITDYRTATGLEALMGYLYLAGDDERLQTLMRAALEETEEET
ncbi:MAG: ribonuclease III domain-containing protein [Clostridia bacterium]|nr:ribonuclease III domain-containing protein [Clostridia bacterium]